VTVPRTVLIRLPEVLEDAALSTGTSAGHILLAAAKSFAALPIDDQVQLIEDAVDDLKDDGAPLTHGVSQSEPLTRAQVKTALAEGRLVRAELKKANRTQASDRTTKRGTEGAMRKIRRKKVFTTVEVVTSVVCNKCGKACETGSSPSGIRPKQAALHVECAWWFGSPKDGETNEWDLCESCYDRFVRAFKIPMTKSRAW